MFIDLEGVPEDWCEVCIIGAGPVGVALGLRLASARIRTLVLESGGERPNKRVQDLSALGTFDPKVHHSSAATVVRALGGTSLRWGGRCVEYDDVDFRRRAHVPEACWPIDHSALKPYYRDARRFLTAEVSEAMEAAQDAPFHHSRETWARIPNAARAHAQALKGRPFLKIAVDATVTHLDLHRETRRLAGLRVVGRRSRRTVVAPLVVLAAGGRETARLLMDAQTKDMSLFGGPSGPLGRYYMGHLTGEIATITFHSAATASRFLFQHSATGVITRRRFIPSAKSQIEHRLLNIAMWPDSLRPDEVIDGNGAASLFHMARHLIRRSRNPIFQSSISPGETSSAHFRNIASHPLQTVYGGSLLLAQRMLPYRRLPQINLISPTKTYLLRYHAEHRPYYDSCIKLSSQTDAHGCPRLDVDFRYGRADFQSVLKAHRLLADWLVTTGLGYLTYVRPEDELEDWVRDQAMDGYHQIGLVRMSRTRKDGVVDSDCRVHDVDNLFIAGSAVFPTSGQANPTLPAVAMALRLADHLTGIAGRHAAVDRLAAVVRQ